ncbi:Acid sphingomyelinase-like phosphodiesterase 3b [Armadillidium vulgare]|nr:Acid sphingomyelinase-like phosphodiesterase 3b [Armadillidium vulgare]
MEKLLKYDDGFNKWRDEIICANDYFQTTLGAREILANTDITGILTIVRLEMSSRNSTGHFGNYLCDAPYALVRSALQALKNIEPYPDFIVWTGDNAPHTRKVDFPVIFKTLSNITEELKSLFNSNIPILPVLGNHDTYPQVVVINTNLYYRNNKLGEDLKDPGFQFKWLRSSLQDAKNTKRKVLIAAHAPPGYWERSPKISFLNDSYNDEFVDILNEFGEQIIGQIYGHEHTDSFRIFGHNLTSVGFLAPSVTPWYPVLMAEGTAINPSLRLYDYSPNSIIDYHQYHMNLTEANKAKLIDSCSIEVNSDLKCSDASRGLWKEYYQATKAFGVTSVDVKGLREVFSKLSNNDSYFQAYYLRNSAGIQNGYCNETCKLNHLCAISHLKIQSLIHCLNSSHENTSDMETLIIFSVAIFFAISLAILILAIVLRRRSRNSS